MSTHGSVTSSLDIARIEALIDTCFPPDPLGRARLHHRGNRPTHSPRTHAASPAHAASGRHGWRARPRSAGPVSASMSPSSPCWARPASMPSPPTWISIS